MLPFFRKIRYQLARENQFLKYSRYAIGEIVLVVFGILIALYINNWNEARKEREFELEMLKEVSNSLNKDRAYLDMIKRRNEIKEKGLQSMLSMIESGEDYPDSVLLKTYNEALTRLSFSYNTGGYESIKSVGLDKISDERIRAGLIELYESSLPVTTQIMTYFMKYQDDNQDMIGLHNALWELTVVNVSDENKKILSKPKSEFFLTQPELIQRMKIEQDIMSFNKMHIRNLEYMVDEGIKLVESELNNP